MASNFPALAVQPPQQPDPLGAYARLMQIKNAQQQQRAGALEMQQKQLELAAQQQQQQDQQKLTASYQQSGGDVSKFLDIARQSGVSEQGIAMAQQSLEKGINIAATADDRKFKTLTQQHQMMGDALAAVNAAVPADQPAVWQDEHQKIVSSGIFDAQGLQQFAQYPGPDGVRQLSAAYTTQDQILKQAAERRLANAQAAQQAHDAAVEAETKRHNLATEGKPSMADLQTQDVAAWLKQNPGKTLTDYDSAKAQSIAGASEAGRQQSLNNQGGAPGSAGNLVDQIGTGRMAVDRLSYLATRNPQLLSQVASKYPDFDSSKVQSYIKAYQDFTSSKPGTAGGALNAGATALKHLAELRSLNTNESRVYGTKDYVAFKNKLDTVAGELVKFYGLPSTNDSESSVKATLGGLFNRDAAITQQAKSMGDKFASYEQTWQNAAPSKAYEAPLPGIDEEAKKSLASLAPDFVSGHPSFAPKASGGAQGGGPASQAAPPGATHTGRGSVDKKLHYLDANGKDLGLAE